jgi:GAF domain-containing protein
MLERLFAYFNDEDDRSPSFIALTRNILIFVMAANAALLPLVTGIIGEDSRNVIAIIALTITLMLEGASMFYVLRGSVRMAKLVVPLALIVAVTVIALNTNGLRNTGIVGLPVIMVISAILLKKRALYTTTPIAIASVIIISVADLRGGIPSTRAGLDDALIIPILLISCAAIIHLLIIRLNENIEKARASEELARRENAELAELRASLEERVRQRTAELEIANQVNERRARQFEAVTRVLNAISAVQDMESLLPQIARVISEQFVVYHTGIFLLDKEREYAVLRAANSEGGQRMLARGHKLLVGQTGIVGFVAATGKPRIALDVGRDAIYFDNPDLPGTRSEIALPLRYGGRIIGVLDVQSVQPNAFGQDDIEALGALADQVSIAINNALAIEEARKSLEEARSAISATTLDAWKIMRPKSLGTGYYLTEAAVKPLEKPLDGDHIREAVQRGEPVPAGDPNQPAKLAIPIRLREQTIGVIHLGSRNGGRISGDDADIAQAVAERLSLAIETSTLLQATQRRADLERVTSDITSRISASTRFETILQTAAQELSRALGGSDVVVQIEPVALKLSGSNE